jgi:hypothetical protein
MNSKTAAIAYRIWAYASPKGWDVSVRQIADELQESPHTIVMILRYKKWTDRVRRVQIADHNFLYDPERWVSLGGVDKGFDKEELDV